MRSGSFRDPTRAVSNIPRRAWARVSARDFSTPHRFRHQPKSQTARARRAFKAGAAGDRIMTALGPLAYVSRLDLARDLKLNKALEHASGLTDAGTVSAIFEAIAATYQGPVYAVLEVGLGDSEGRGRLHTHVIHHRDDGPAHIPRDTKRCERVYDPVGLYAYLAKEPEPWTLEAELDARAALVLSASRKLPRTRRHFLGPERMAWAASYCTNGLTVPNDPQPAPVLKTIALGSFLDEKTSDDLAQLSFGDLLKPAEADRDRAFFGLIPEVRVLLSGTQKPSFIQQKLFGVWGFGLQDAHFQAVKQGAERRFKQPRSPPIQTSTNPAQSTAAPHSAYKRARSNLKGDPKLCPMPIF